MSEAAPRTRPARKRRLLKFVGLLVILGLVTALLATDPKPAADARSAPSPEQVQAGRDAAYQLLAPEKRIGRLTEIRFGAAQLDGLSALATHGFKPDRLDMRVEGSLLRLTASHALPWGRWLNVRLAAGKGARAELRVGSIPLPSFMDRILFDVVRRIVRIRGVDLPAFDSLVREFAVVDGTVVATVETPAQSDWVYRLAGETGRVDPALVVRAYCRLAEAQKVKPEADFAVQVQRAFPAAGAASASADTNRAGLIALAMLVVDKRVGLVAGLSDAQVAECTAAPSAITLHGRTDLPMHWSLSAAIAAKAGVQLAEAMGEWKELSDSLANRPEFRPGDASGFSFVDLATDRSGFRIARSATSMIEARAMAQRLSSVTQDQLLPPALLKNSDGMPEAEFIKAYGGIEDPRYLAAVKSIDGVLARQGLAAP